MPTPTEVRASHALTTKEQVDSLAKLLQEILPSMAGRDLPQLIKDCRDDGEFEYAIIRQMLGSAYDWYRFGN